MTVQRYMRIPNQEPDPFTILKFLLKCFVIKSESHARSLLITLYFISNFKKMLKGRFVVYIKPAKNSVNAMYYCIRYEYSACALPKCGPSHLKPHVTITSCDRPLRPLGIEGSWLLRAALSRRFSSTPIAVWSGDSVVSLLLCLHAPYSATIGLATQEVTACLSP